MVDKLDLWGDSDYEDPGSAKTTEGWVPGEQPRNDWWNWIHRRDEIKVNELVSDAPSGYPADSEAQLSQIMRLITSDASCAWGTPSAARNQIASSATNKYVDLAFFVADPSDVTYGDPQNPQKKYLLALDAAHCCCDIVDAQDLAEAGSIVLNSGGKLPAAPAVWVPRAMCTDGTYIYVYFWDTQGGTVDATRIQAYDIYTGSVRTGWPATGTAGVSLGGIALDETVTGDIEFVSSTRLAVANPYITPALGSMISVVDASVGTLIDSGKGDCNLALGDGFTGSAHRLCGDGTNIYFTARETGDATQVCSASIASPGSPGSGTANWPAFEDDNNHVPAGIIYTGREVIVSWRDTASSPDVLSHHTAGLGQLAYIYADNKEFISTGGAMAFDGLNLWMRGSAWSDGGDENFPVVVKLKLGTLPIVVTSDIPYIVDRMLTYKHITADSVIGAVSAEITQSPIIFDGRDIWYVGDRRASQTWSGYIFRIPKAILR